MSKRANNEGTIYKELRNGREVWRANYWDADGRKRYLSAKTKDAVAQKLSDARSAVAAGVPVPSAKETLGQFLGRWLTDVCPLRLRATSLRDYRRDVERHIVPAIGKLKLNEVTPQRVQVFLNKLSAKGLGPPTVQKVRAVLRSALTRAQKEGLIAQNAAKLVDTPRAPQKKVAALTTERTQAILAAFKGHDYEALITVALATGLRRGELLGLGWEDIDLDERTLTVRQQLQRIDGEYRLVEPKSATSHRTLSLPSIAVAALRAHKLRQTEARLQLGRAWQETGRVFTTASGSFLNDSTVSHRFAKHLKEAGLPHMPFHDQRHGAATLLLAQGASLREVMEQLGHSQISLTANTYTHIAPALLRENAARLDRALGATG